MLAKLISAIVCITTIMGFSSELQAQTCEMRVGTDRDGNPIIVTAYEYGYLTERPSFPGGDDKFLEFINDNREYPEEAYQRGVQGKVTCQFLIDTDGSVKYVSLLKEANSLLAREALRILNMMPSWRPGKINGVPVKVRVVKAIPFRR